MGYQFEKCIAIDVSFKSRFLSDDCEFTICCEVTTNIEVQDRIGLSDDRSVLGDVGTVFWTFGELSDPDITVTHWITMVLKG